MAFKLPFSKKDNSDRNSIKSFSSYKHLEHLRPKSGYVFHSDYFEIDSSVACIMDFYHHEGAHDNFAPFWGVNMIPAGLDNDVTVVLIEQIHRESDGWVKDHQAKAETVANMNSKEQDNAGSNTTRATASKNQEELMEIALSLQNGSSYMSIAFRLLVKAPTLEKLEHALDDISRLYVDRFGTLEAGPHIGEQKQDMKALFGRNDTKPGKRFYMTSEEFAGSYSIVTHGIEDKHGEYIGYMVGDVNNSAVLFNVNNYSHHVLVASNGQQKGTRIWNADKWASKFSQACLMHGHKVVHIIMDDCNLDDLGPKFERISYKIDMNHGDVNMFELFGRVEDELSLFPSQMQKLILMAEQAYQSTDADRAIIRGNLEQIATKYYIDMRMWHENAESHRDKLRIIGIPHEQVPRLDKFVSYLETEYKKSISTSARDEEQIHALQILRLTFRNMLSNNGDLFNTVTTNKIDGAKVGQRVIYDFSSLSHRGKGVAMAQLVNIIAFACANLGEDDLIIFHGADEIADGVKPYIIEQLNKLYKLGGRAAFCYNDIDKAIHDKKFSHFDNADYTIFGGMTKNLIKQYQDELGYQLPSDLVSQIVTKSNKICYIRREYTNVVLHEDLILNP